MTIVKSNLGRGTLSSQTVPIISPGAVGSTQMTVKTLKFTNTHTGQVTLNVQFRWKGDGSSVSMISDMILDPKDTVHYLESGEVIELETADTIEASCDVEDVVTYMAWGDKDEG